jgi:hypothetical protein
LTSVKARCSAGNIFHTNGNEKGEAAVLHERTRIIFALVVAVLASGFLAFAFLADPVPAQQHDDILLIYVGAEDCAPCRKWQREDAANFRTSAEFSRLVYREVKSPTLFAVLNDENWPAELRGYRDSVAPGAGVPLWLIISNSRIIEQRFGESQWQAAILPKIKSLLR